MKLFKGIQLSFEQVDVTEEEIQTKLKALFPYTDNFFFTMTEQLTCLPDICYELNEGEYKHLYIRIPITANMEENRRLMELALNNRCDCKRIIIGANAFSCGRCDIETIRDCVSYARHDLDMALEQVIMDETYHTFVNTDLLENVYEVMLNYTPSSRTMTPHEAAGEALMQRMMIGNITEDIVSFGELGPLDTEEKTLAYITLLATIQEKRCFDELMMFIPEQYMQHIAEAIMGSRGQVMEEILPAAILQRDKGIEIYYWLPYDHDGDGEFQSHGRLCGIVNGYSLLTHEIALFGYKNGHWDYYKPAMVRKFNAFGLWRATMAWFAGFREPDTVTAILLKKENRGEEPLSYEQAKAQAVAYAEYKR